MKFSPCENDFLVLELNFPPQELECRLLGSVCKLELQLQPCKLPFDSLDAAVVLGNAVYKLLLFLLNDLRGRDLQLVEASRAAERSDIAKMGHVRKSGDSQPAKRLRVTNCTLLVVQKDKQ